MRWMRRKVGRGVQAQAPAGKNDHGDTEEADKVQGRWARVQALVLRRELRRREAGCTHQVYVCKRAGPIAKFTTPGSYYSNISKYSTLYVATFPLTISQKYDSTDAFFKEVKLLNYGT